MLVNIGIEKNSGEAAAKKRYKNEFNKILNTTTDYITNFYYKADITFLQWRVDQDGDGNYDDSQNLILVKPYNERKKITVQKIWDDSNNSLGVRPEEITVKITGYKNNDTSSTKYEYNLKLNDSNKWKAQTTVIAKVGNTDYINYQVEETGRYYLYVKNYEQAIKDYTKAIELGEKNIAIYYTRGMAYAKLGDYNENKGR